MLNKHHDEIREDTKQLVLINVTKMEESDGELTFM